MAIDWTFVWLVVGGLASVLLVIFELPRFMRWLRTRGKEDEPKSPKAPPQLVNLNVWNAPAVQLTAVSAPPPVSRVDLHLEPELKVIEIPPPIEPIKVAALPESKSMSTHTEDTLFDGTLKAEAGGFDECHFKLEKGFTVKVFGREISGQTFDFYLMNRKNFSTFCSGGTSTYLFAQTDESIVEFRRKVPKSDVWYFILHAPLKRNDRELRLEISSLQHEKSYGIHKGLLRD